MRRAAAHTQRTQSPGRPSRRGGAGGAAAARVTEPAAGGGIARRRGAGAPPAPWICRGTRVGRVAGSLGSRGAKTWRPRHGRSLNRKNIIHATISDLNHHHPGDNWIPSPLLPRTLVLNLYPRCIYSQMNVFTYIAIKKKIPILTNVRAGTGNLTKCSGRAGRPGSLGVAGRGSLILRGVAGRGARVGDPPRPCQHCWEPRRRTHIRVITHRPRNAGHFSPTGSPCQAR